MITRIVRFVSLSACLALLPLPASSQAAPPQGEWIRALRDGGHAPIVSRATPDEKELSTPKKSFIRFCTALWRLRRRNAR